MGGGEKINVNNDRQVLGKRIAELRKERGWRQVDLAYRVGVSPRLITLYEQQGPPAARLSQLDAVFGGALLAGTSLETLPLEGMTAQAVAATNGTSVPDRTRDFVEQLVGSTDDLAAMDAADADLAAAQTADQDCVTRGMEPLGSLFDEMFGRLRAIEQAVADLAKQANR